MTEQRVSESILAMIARNWPETEKGMMAIELLALRAEREASVPVAWRCWSQWKNFKGVWMFTPEKSPHSTWDWQPLYAAPQPAAQPNPEAAGGRWQPIETAPKGTFVLLLNSKMDMSIGDWGRYCIVNAPKFTHWMPLPAAPESKP